MGTSPDGSDVSVTGGWRSFGAETNGYISNLSLSMTNESANSSLYYVAVRAVNKALLLSSIKVSTCIKVVHKDVAGLVVDGPDLTDIDVQAQVSTATCQFSGFSSEKYGIEKYEWALVTKTGNEIQPYTEVGIVVDSSGNGFAQIPFPLSIGQRVNCSVKAINGIGDTLLSVSDGVIPDITAPVANLTRIGSKDENLTQFLEFYEKSSDSLGVSWIARDSESFVKQFVWSAGSFPGDRSSVKDQQTLDTSSPAGAVSNVKAGVPTFFTVEAINGVGLKSTIYGPGVTVDYTPPSVEGFRCPSWIVSTTYSITCYWDSVDEAESKVSGYRLLLGNGMDDSALGVTDTKDSTISSLTLVKRDQWPSNGTLTATLQVFNVLNFASSKYAFITIDTTPPVRSQPMHKSDVFIFPEESNPGRNSESVQCQSSQTRSYIFWKPFQDPESSMRE